MKSFTAFNEMVSNKKQKEATENAKLDRKSALKVASKTYKEDTELEEGLKQARKNVGMDPDKPSCWKGYKATGTKMKGGKQVPDCKKEDEKITKDQLKEIGFTLTEVETLKVYKGAGCSKCNNSGYKGRQGIYEILDIFQSRKSRNILTMRISANFSFCSRHSRWSRIVYNCFCNTFREAGQD